jgi:hypothetical protein
MLVNFLSCALHASSDVVYYGVVKDPGSGKAVGQVRVDAIYLPISLFHNKTGFTIASTYTDDRGAFVLSIPASAGHKVSFLSATRIESTTRADGRLDHPDSRKSNTVLVTTYRWHSPQS